MTTLDYFQLIQNLRPNSIFSIDGNNYSSLVWHTNNTSTKPTESEILSKNTEIVNMIAYDHLRTERDRLLTESDRYSLSDYPHENDTIKDQWLNYRQQLRDITSQIPKINLETGEVIGITWPTRPS